MPEFEIFEGDKEEVLKMFKKDNIALVFFILLAIVVGIVVAVVAFLYNNQQNADTIQAGVFIKGINVSGLTKEEATALVKEKIVAQMNDQIELIYKDNKYYVEIEQIGAKFDIESSVNFAFNIAKNGDFFQNMKTYINVLMTNVNIEPNLVYDDNALTEYLKTIEANLPDQLIQSSYYVDDDELVIVNGTNGAGIKFDELKELILGAIQDISYSRSYISIPTYIQYPDKIDVDAIHDEVYRKMENAYFTTEPYAVFADVVGIDFDVDAMKNVIENHPEAEEYYADLIYTKPEITVQDFGREAFPNLLASFSTNYPASNTDRTTNLRLAAKKIDGYVLMPGEIFSYNKVVGKRTIAAGYKEAAIYQDGGVTSGLGGGICQISTTLYNAAIEAGMLIEQRRNHMFVPSYAAAGKDATVVWGSTDFQFENRRNYPIKIETSVSGGVANIKIYGLKTEEEYDKYKLSIETKTIKSTDNTLVVESYRVYRNSDGKIVKSEKLYTDTYKKH